MNGAIRRWWIALRVVLLLLFGVQAAYYYARFVREHRLLHDRVLSHVPEGGDAERTLRAILPRAFQLPPHLPLAPRYGLRHPLMKLLRPAADLVYQKGGMCAWRSRLLVVLLHDRGIPARKLYLYNERGLTELTDPPRSWVHVVVEARVNGRWVVADPLFNVVFEKDDGTLATDDEIRADPGLLARGRSRADERYDVWMDHLYDYREVRRFPWFQIPVLGTSLYRLIGSVFGKRAADGVPIPHLLEEPYLAIVWISVGLMALLGLTFLKGRRRRPSTRPGGPAPAGGSD